MECRQSRNVLWVRVRLGYLPFNLRAVVECRQSRNVLWVRVRVRLGYLPFNLGAAVECRQSVNVSFTGISHTWLINWLPVTSVIRRQLKDNTA